MTVLLTYRFRIWLKKLEIQTEIKQPSNKKSSGKLNRAVTDFRYYPAKSATLWREMARKRENHDVIENERRGKMMETRLLLDGLMLDVIARQLDFSEIQYYRTAYAIFRGMGMQTDLYYNRLLKPVKQFFSCT